MSLPRCSYPVTPQNTTRYTWHSPGLGTFNFLGLVYIQSTRRRIAFSRTPRSYTFRFGAVVCCFFVVYFVHLFPTTTIRCGCTLLAETLNGSSCISVHEVVCSSSRVFRDSFPFHVFLLSSKTGLPFPSNPQYYSRDPRSVLTSYCHTCCCEVAAAPAVRLSSRLLDVACILSLFGSSISTTQIPLRPHATTAVPTICCMIVDTSLGRYLLHYCDICFIHVRMYGFHCGETVLPCTEMLDDGRGDFIALAF